MLFRSEPWPGGYGFLRGQRFQIWKAVKGAPSLAPGALRVIGKKLYAGCGAGESIELLEIQTEGKKRMPAAAFLNGFQIAQDEGLQ